MVLLEAVHSVAGTFHCLAADATSMMRGRGSGLAKLIPAARDGGGAAGGLRAVDFGIDGGLLDFDEAPVRVELLGDDEGEGGLDALADFGALGEDGDGVVGATRYEGVHEYGGVGMGFDGFGFGGAGFAGVEMEDEGEAAAGKGCFLEEGSAAHGGGRRWGSSAAR